MRFPDEDSLEDMSNEFARQHNSKGLHCFGAIDGKHFKGQFTHSDYLNYKHFTSINCLAIANHNLLFLWAAMGWAGRHNDKYCFKSSWLANSGIGEWLAQRGFFSLGDLGFCIREFLIIPYTDLQADTREKRAFNYVLRSLRACIERAWGVLVGRFRVFQGGIASGDAEFVQASIKAGMALHNLCVLDRDDLVQEEDICYIPDVPGLLPPPPEDTGAREKGQAKREQIFQAWLASMY